MVENSVGHFLPFYASTVGISRWTFPSVLCFHSRDQSVDIHFNSQLSFQTWTSRRISHLCQGNSETGLSAYWSQLCVWVGGGGGPSGRVQLQIMLFQHCTHPPAEIGRMQSIRDIQAEVHRSCLEVSEWARKFSSATASPPSSFVMNSFSGI